jgi:5-methyltetrahydrofolate--homocysteine methyltransferase
MTLEAARANRTPIRWREEDLAEPGVTGVHVLPDVSLATLREYIDWTPFFHTWELKGVYPRIFQHEKYGDEARKLFAEANTLLDEIVAKKLLTARGVYGIFPASAVGDDVQLYADESRKATLARFHFLRQQAPSGDRDKSAPNRSLADFVAPEGSGLRDHLGAFAVTTGLGLKELCDSFRARHDDYNAIMAEALADRLAEASAGYPACPDHTEKGTLWKLLDVEKNTGMRLTESYAMWPGSSVSGLYFAHPEARYFTLGKIDRDQVADYRGRKGMTTEEVERWLGPNLGYEPSN